MKLYSKKPKTILLPGGYGHQSGGYGEGRPVQVIPVNEATYHSYDHPTYPYQEEDDKKGDGIWGVLKGMTELFSKKDDEPKNVRVVRQPSPPKPQVIEVKVPQCNPVTNYITTVITESVPVSILYIFY